MQMLLEAAHYALAMCHRTPQITIVDGQGIFEIKSQILLLNCHLQNLHASNNVCVLARTTNMKILSTKLHVKFTLKYISYVNAVMLSIQYFCCFSVGHHGEDGPTDN